MKKVLSFILVLSMVLGSMGMAFANPTEANKSAIDKMVELGFVKGDDAGLRLDETIKRSEVAAIATRMLGLEDIANASNYQGAFTDVTTEHWANGNINVAAGQGLVKGYPEGTFQPEGDVTNAEVIALMVRMALSATEVAELDKGVWPAAYITKAVELGLLEGANIANYQAPAVREAVFVIGYNAYTILEEEDIHVVKAIVLENDRVEKLGANEVVVEVLKEVVKADFVADSRKDEGAQLRLTLPEGFDTENLLGKVVDIAFDKTDAIVRIVEDTNYTVVTGPVKAEAKKLTVDGKAYTVSLDERYENKDERVYRTYLNNKALSYREFFEDATRAKGTKAAEKFETDYARVTIHNGKVVLIDAYQFNDIAPVQEVKKDGEEVVVYNDARDGGVKKLELKATTKVLVVEEGQMTKGTRTDIKANDVVHAFEGGYVVRRDAAVNGTYDKVVDNKDGIFVQVDGTNYEVLEATNKKPVYSFDSKEFYTLEAKQADRVLREFKGEKVTVLLDVNGNLQYIGSEIEIGEFVGLISNVVGKDARIVKSDGTKAEYTATLDSVIKLEESTGHKNLQVLEKGDLVYASVDGDNIDTIVRLVSVDVEGTLVLTNKTDITRNFIKTDKEYKILDRTNVFIRKGNQLEGTTIEAVLKNYNETANVKAYVVTDKEFTDILKAQKLNPRRDVSTSEKVAHTIIFTEIDYKSDLDREVAEILDIYTSGRDYELKLRLEDGTVTRTVKRNSDAWDVIDTKGIEKGAVVRAGISKDDAKVIEELELLIKKNEVTYEVRSNQASTGLRSFRLLDRLGKDSEDNDGKTIYWLSRTATVLGNLENGSVIAYHLDTDTNEIDAVIVIGHVDKRTPVTASYDNLGTINGLAFGGYNNGKVVLDGRAYNVYGDIEKFFADTVNNESALYRALVDVTLDGRDVIAINGILIDSVVDGKTLDGKGLRIKDRIVVNGDNVTIKNVDAKEIYQYAETLNVDAATVNAILVNAVGENTLTVNNSTVGTITVNKKHTVKLTGTTTVKEAVVVKAKGSEVQVNTTGTAAADKVKVKVEVADVKVTGSNANVVRDESVAPEVTDAKVTDVVYKDGKTTVTFEVKTKNANRISVAIKDDVAAEKRFALDQDAKLVIDSVLEDGKYTFEVFALEVRLVESNYEELSRSKKVAEEFEIKDGKLVK